jgi:hypothetical protein
MFCSRYEVRDQFAAATTTEASVYSGAWDRSFTTRKGGCLALLAFFASEDLLENPDEKVRSAPFKTMLPCGSLRGIVEPIYQVVEHFFGRSFLAVLPDYLRSIPAAADFEDHRSYWFRKPYSAFACNLARNPGRPQPDR